MSTPIVFNNQSFIIPSRGTRTWTLSDYLIAIASGAIQPSGGLFSLTAELDLGSNYGIKTKQVKSETANPASAGMLQMARTDLIEWRNQANSGNNTLGVNSSNALEYNGTAIPTSALSPTLTSAHIFVGNGSNVATDTAMTGDISITNAGVTAIGSGKITNAMIDASAAIAYSKLALTGAIQAADIASGQVVKTVNSLTDAVTLAAGTNITITPSGNTLTFAASGGGGGGSPNIQMGTLATSVATSTGGYVTTGLTVTITPSSSSNQVLVMMTGNVRNDTSGDGAYIDLFRGGVTDTGNTHGLCQLYVANAAVQNTDFPCSFTYLSSPASTSAQTYTVMFKSLSAGPTATFNDSTGLCTLIAWEVKS